MVIPDSICHLKSRQRLLANFVRWKPFGNSSQGQKKKIATQLEYRLNIHRMIKSRYGEKLIERGAFHFKCIYFWPLCERRHDCSFFPEETIVKHASSIFSSKQIIHQRSTKKERKIRVCVPPIIQITFSCAKQKMVCSSIKILYLFLQNGIVSYINTTNILISFLWGKKHQQSILCCFNLLISQVKTDEGGIVVSDIQAKKKTQQHQRV